VAAALAAGDLSESYGRTICQWTDRLPEKYRDGSDELLVAAAAGGLVLADLSALFAEMYERARSELPDEDPGREFADRGVRLETTWQGAGVMTGDLTPECAVVVAKVLDALGAPAGKDDDRTREQRYHDALAEAMRQLRKCIVTCITRCGNPNSRHSLTVSGEVAVGVAPRRGLCATADWPRRRLEVLGRVAPHIRPVSGSQ
jgi:hypothetical protein